MSTRTNFLDLVLPELNEFINTWNAPVNQNMESIDDFCEDLFESLVGSSATSTWAALRGSLASLATRLDVSINADGTIDLSASPDLLAIAASSYTGQFSSPVDRLNDGDRVTYNGGLPVTGDRFSPIPSSGPTAGFPHSDLESGIAIRDAHFGISGEQAASPHLSAPWSPGLVTGGGGTFVTSPSTGKVQFNGLASPTVFNIDGHVFRLREDVILDYATIAPPPVNGQYVWFFVDRNDGGYNDATFKYGAAVLAKDLRRLQSGVAGATSGSTFTDAAALFNTAPLGVVREGDPLVIPSGGAAGTYVVDSITNNTTLIIKGTFKANLSGLTWRIQDDWHPNLGAVAVATAAGRPPFVAGRVYIARGIHNTGGPTTSIVTFRSGGVYDSGWTTASDPQTFPHNLGAVPSSVEIWVRASSTGQAYRPLVRRAVMTNLTITGIAPVGGDRKYATFLFPSMYVRSDEVDATVALINLSTDPVVPVAFFTDSAGIDWVAGQIRVVARR
jgi:hypothetical protein